MRLSSSQGGNVKNRTSGLKVRPPWVWWFAFIVIVLAGFPLAVSDPFSQQVVIMALMFGALGAAWNLVGGFLGRVSFGHAVFVGVGAYTTLLLLRDFHVSPWFGLPLGGLASAALAFIIGKPTFRLKIGRASGRERVCQYV